MKKIKSSTKKELGKLLVDLAINKIDTWTKQQITRMRYSNKLSICVPLSHNKWVIGPYNLVEKAPHQYILSLDNKCVATFFSRAAAIYYGILIRSSLPRHNKLAHEILAEDTLVGKLHDETQFYSIRLAKNTAKVDSFRVDLWRVRLNEARLQLKKARKDLQKNLDSAKYIKMWDT